MSGATVLQQEEQCHPLCYTMYVCNVHLYSSIFINISMPIMAFSVEHNTESNKLKKLEALIII